MATQEIAKGSNGKAFEIYFPKRMIFLMKILGIIPTLLLFSDCAAVAVIKGAEGFFHCGVTACEFFVV